MITYSLLLFEGGFALFRATLVLGDCLFTLVLQDSDCVSAVTHILNAQVQSLVNPPVDTAKNHRVLVDFLFFDRLDGLLEEAQLLILLVLFFGLAERIVLCHLLEQVLADQLLGLLEVELVGVTLANLFS